MRKQTLLSITAAIALAATLVVNYLANALPINGLGTGDISDRYDVLFKPAGYAFSIWGLIYLGLIGFAVYQASSRGRLDTDLIPVRIAFIINCLANAAWIFAWHYEQLALSVLIMAVILSSLVFIYLRLGVGRVVVPAATRWLVHHPFSLYLGWICVATVANVTIFLDRIGWNGFGLSDTFWFIAVVLVALTLSALFALRRRDLVVTLVFLWAITAVAVHNGETSGVNTLSWIAAGLAAVPVIIAWFRSVRFAARNTS